MTYATIKAMADQLLADAMLDAGSLGAYGLDRYRMAEAILSGWRRQYEAAAHATWVRQEQQLMLRHIEAIDLAIGYLAEHELQYVAMTAQALLAGSVREVG